MKRLKGPEIKLSELKMPTILVDLYWDLRDRHLLPLVALAVVAIIAVPFLLSGGSDKTPPTATELEAVDPTAEHAAAMAVLPANPGLRDYRKRLRNRSAADPFAQRYQDSGSDLAGAQLGSGEEGAPSPSSSVSSTSTSTSTSTGTSTTKATKTTRSEGGVTTTETKTETDTTIPPVQAGAEPDLTIYGWAIDLKLKSSETAPDGQSVTRRTVTRSGVVAPTPLPSKEVQAVTFMGVNPKTGNPLLIISDEVASVFGDGECLSGAQACQLLEVEVGIPTTFFYGPNGDSYKINITKVDIVRTGKG
jgi:hypothetical protein